MPAYRTPTPPESEPDPMASLKREAARAAKQDSSLLGGLSPWYEGYPFGSLWLLIPLVVAAVALKLSGADVAWFYPLFAVGLVGLIALARWHKAMAYLRETRRAQAEIDQKASARAEPRHRVDVGEGEPEPHEESEPGASKSQRR